MSTKPALVVGVAILLSVAMVCGTRITTTRGQLQLARERAEAEEGPTRYELKDYKHGNVVGMALLDRYTGRVWIYTSLTGERGKTERNMFAEVEVDGLWGTTEAVVSSIRGLDDETKKMVWGDHDRNQQLKLLTRPKLVRSANEQIERETSLDLIQANPSAQE